MTVKEKSIPMLILLLAFILCMIHFAITSYIDGQIGYMRFALVCLIVSVVSTFLRHRK